MSDLRYTKDHEWLIFDGPEMTVGITDFAQQQLGDIVFVELPEPGSEIKAHDEAVVIESVKAAGEILMPASGTVIEVNEVLAEDPERVNEDPQGEGWLFKMRLAEGAVLPELLNEEQYQQLITD